MKYNELTLGRIEAIINRLGGMEGVNDLLSGKSKVVYKEENWVDELRASGFIDESFDKKSVHELEIKPLTKEEAISAFRASGDPGFISDYYMENLPYNVPDAKILQMVLTSPGKKINSDQDTQEFLDKMGSLGLRPATLEELFQFTIANPEYQVKNDLVGLGTRVNIYRKGLSVPAIIKHYPGSTYFIFSWHRFGGWATKYRFLFVRREY